MSDKKRDIKNYIGEITVIAVILAILLTILVPTLSSTFNNGSQKKTEKKLYTIQRAFNSAITAEGADIEKWNNIINNKNSDELIDAIKSTMGEELAEKINTKNYYAKYHNGCIYFYSTKYRNIDNEFFVKLTNAFDTSLLDAKEKNASAERIQVTGFRTRLKNESLNPDNPEQMRFTNDDDLKKIFSDLLVSLVNIGGQKRQLSNDEYKIITQGIDMSYPGEKNIKIVYESDKIWQKTLYAEFKFNVMDKIAGTPLEITFDNGETYILAAWDWSDYVAEANEAQGESKMFDASIVCYEGKYYYYPDGFIIDKRRDNSNPKTSAASIDDPMIAAYDIEFRTDIKISSKENKEEMKKVQDGAVMLEEDKVYIWQSEPSKELDAGWIRVFCELSKK